MEAEQQRSTDGIEELRSKLRRVARESRRLRGEKTRRSVREMPEYLRAFRQDRLNRERAICAAHREGLGVDEIASALGTEPIGVFRVLQRYRSSGEGLGST